MFGLMCNATTYPETGSITGKVLKRDPRERRGGGSMRKGMVVALIMYVLISGGGAVSGTFNSSVDCETSRLKQGALGYCLPLWR